MKKASTLEVVINFTDEQGNDLPITGGTLKFMIKASLSDSDNDALVTKVPTTTAQVGECICTITHTEANALPFDQLLYAEAAVSIGGTLVRTETVQFRLERNLIQTV